MRIALYGVGGLYNYGCEAIVRGTTEIIKRTCPDAKIIYYSRRAEEDLTRIKDMNIQVKQLDKGYNRAFRVVNKFLRKFGIPIRCGEKSFSQVIKEVDAIVSIGGDIYTMPEFEYNQEKYQYYKGLVQFGEQAIKCNKKFIIYGASIGPFGNYKKAQKYYFSHFKKVNLIVAREERCMTYLKENNINDNVCFLPDPAFAVEMPEDTEVIAKYIGINLSPLSLESLYGKIPEDKVRNIAIQIQLVWERTKIPVLLIPHVVSPITAVDNDLLFMQDLYRYFSDEFKAHVTICEPKGFLDAKSILRSCRILVAARMHCAINAVSESVPTLFLSYSEKAKGMAQFIYGDGRWQIQLSDLDNQLPYIVEDLLKHADEERIYLKRRIKDIRDSMYLSNTLNRIREELGVNA